MKKIMAENKKSFVLYTDSQGLVNQLPDEVAGRLLKHIYAYVNDENPISDELLLNIAFEPIKMQLKRDLVKWEKSLEDRSRSGRLGNLKRYNIDLYNKVIDEILTLEDAEVFAKTRKGVQSDTLPSQDVAKLAVNDNVSVSVNVNVNDNEIKDITALPKFSFYHSLITYGGNENLVSDWLKVRKTKKATNTETAYKKFINQVEKSGHSINDVLEKCIEKSWSGFDADWYKKENVKQQKYNIDELRKQFPDL
jgi:hypothetical protein